MFNKTFLEQKSTFLSLHVHTLWEVNFQPFLSYQSSCDHGELVLCYNKRSRDFDFKQRPTLAYMYYNKGSAQFVARFLHNLWYFSKKKSETAKQRKKLQSNVSQMIRSPNVKILVFSQQFF